MTILDLVFAAYNIVGTSSSIVGGINHAIKHFCQTTAEELFKKSFVKVVKQYASDFADLTDPKTVEVDPDTFDNVIASLKDADEVQFTQLNGSEKIAKITTLFQNCIIVPNHQLPNMDFERRIRPIIERVIIDFYAQLPFKQKAFNQFVLEYIQNSTTEQANTHSMLTDFVREIEQVQIEVSERITQDLQTIKDDTEDIKDDNRELKQTTGSNSLDTWESLIGNPELGIRCRIDDFDSDLLLEIAKRANWKLAEPYNSYVLALGAERMNGHSVLDVAVNFLFKLWEESILFRQKEFLTFGLLTGLTYGRNADTVLSQLEYLIQNKRTLFLPVENSIRRRINEFKQIYPLEDNFMFLAENDIRLKGTRVGIETILYEYIHNSKMPVVIADHYYTPTLEQIYATILYYLQNQEKVGTYLEDYLEYCRKAREEYEKDPPPGVVRLRKLIAESENVSDNLQHDSASATQSSSKNEQG
jgi:uncharacterized protein (DUF433 family)